MRSLSLALPLALAAALVLPLPLLAKPISGDQLGRALELCILQDGTTFDLGDSWGCCLRTPPPPFCVICEGEPEYGKTCDISAARNGRPPKGAQIGGGKGALDDMIEMLPATGGKAVVDPNASAINP